MTRINLKFIALALLLGGLLPACQKEEMVEQNYHAVENNEATTITYVIDNELYTAEIRNDREREELFSYLLLMAKEGHKVSCYDESKQEQTYVAKEKVTYETTSEAEAKEWIKKMVKEGYEVDLTYDEKTRTYICTATR